ncbi:MAG: hypothetical protein ACTHZ5_10880 [Micrococcaceae bacterium]
MSDDARRGDAPRPDDDAAWRRIVLDLGGTEEQALADAPDARDHSETISETAPHPTPVGPRDYVPADEPDDFVPADPPALASGNPRMVLTWIAAVGSPIALVLLMLLAPQAPFWVRAGLVVIFILGLAGLFLAVPTSRARAEQPPDESDYGGGAKI